MYYDRLVERNIKRKLQSSGAVLVAGPKFCGKTTTCMLFQNSFVKLNTKQAITMARMNPNIRSKTSIRSTPTRHFVDTSLACCALNIHPEDLMQDLESFGLFFEDMAVRDLQIYADYLGGEVRHYRDNAGLECDAIIHLEDGRWGAIEIKLGGDDLIESGARSLKTLRDKIIEKSDGQAPTFMMVLTAVGGLYQREDGVWIVPINMLKP